MLRTHRSEPPVWLRQPFLLGCVLASAACCAFTANSPITVRFSYSVPSYSCYALARCARFALRLTNSVSVALRAHSLHLLTSAAPPCALSTQVRPRVVSAALRPLHSTLAVAAPFFVRFAHFIWGLSTCYRTYDPVATLLSYAAAQLSVSPSGS